MLRAEAEALAARDTERLDLLSGRKREFARRLESQASPALIAGLRATRQRLRNGEPPADSESVHLYALIDEAARLNRSNGAVIAQQLAHVRLSMSRLLPQGTRAGLYGRDGQGRPGGLRRSFGLA